MYKVVPSKQFRKDYKKLCKSGHFDVLALNKVINTLSAGKALEEKYKDHSLTGRLKDFRECHVKPDLLLIYAIEKNQLILQLIRVGNHNELFL